MAYKNIDELIAQQPNRTISLMKLQRFLDKKVWKEFNKWYLENNAIRASHKPTDKELEICRQYINKKISFDEFFKLSGYAKKSNARYLLGRSVDFL